MSRVSDYAYINAMLRARIGIMRSSDIIENMIKAPTLVEAVSKLDGTRHQHIAEVYRKTGDLEAAELSLIEEQIASYREVVPYLPRESSFFMTVLLEKIEIENLKTAIRLWYSGAIMHRSISDRAKYICRTLIVHSIDYDRITNASSFSDIISAVSGTPYHDVLGSFAFESLSASGLFPLEIALDHLWFSRLIGAAKRLPSVDRKLAEAIYNVDIDLKNILILVRYGYYYHLEVESLAAAIIPEGYIGGEFIQISPASRNCINIMEIRRVDQTANAIIDGVVNENSILAKKIQQLHIFFLNCRLLSSPIKRGKVDYWGTNR